MERRDPDVDPALAGVAEVTAFALGVACEMFEADAPERPIRAVMFIIREDTEGGTDSIMAANGYPSGESYEVMALTAIGTDVLTTLDTNVRRAGGHMDVIAIWNHVAANRPQG